MALNNIDLFFLLICDLDWAQQVSSALLLAPELEWPEQLGLVGNLPFLHDPFCQAGKLGRMAQGSKNKCSKGTSPTVQVLSQSLLSSSLLIVSLAKASHAAQSGVSVGLHDGMRTGRCGSRGST